MRRRSLRLLLIGLVSLAVLGAVIIVIVITTNANRPIADSDLIGSWTSESGSGTLDVRADGSFSIDDMSVDPWTLLDAAATFSGEGTWQSDAKVRDVVLSFADWRESEGSSAGVPDPASVTSFGFHMRLSGERKDLTMSFTATDPDTFFTFTRVK